ncbi:MAG: hypothetical protein IKN04_10895 [Clostridia bacterium]|nr:hypothetical protein [Clostridia bacterium]
MDIHGAGEALYIACQMEKRAIRLYERALVLFTDGACQDAVRSILAEEKNHLDQFSRMGAETPDFERAQLLSAKASEVLFSGGLVEAQRKGAFESVRGLYAYAAMEEEEAVRQYTAFASSLTCGPASAFSAIALEEKQHLKKLNALLAQAKAEQRVES